MLLNWLKTHLSFTNRSLLHYKVPLKPNGRRLVIPDIHGCIRTLEMLITKIALKKEDQLFFLGDYINKGTDSRAVLDFLIDLKQEYTELHFLRGNHEDMLLQKKAQGAAKLQEYLELYQSSNLLEYFELPHKYEVFLENLPFYIDTGDYLLVHAGFNFSEKKPFKDYEAMLLIRDYPVNQELLSYKRIIHGHNPKPLNVIKNHIEEHSPVIPLDNGCVYYGEREGHGNLLCFDLDTQELIIQPNVEK